MGVEKTVGVMEYVHYAGNERVNVSLRTHLVAPRGLTCPIKESQWGRSCVVCIKKETLEKKKGAESE